MSQLLDDLRALDALFSDESKWTKGAYARSATGRSLPPNDPDACRWCLSGGALVAAEGDYGRRDAIERALEDFISLAAQPASWWNDIHSRRFDSVKNLIAKAIATEEGRVSP